MKATSPTEKHPINDTTMTKDGIQVATVVETRTTKPREIKRWERVVGPVE
jgi:hypothetical protein